MARGRCGRLRLHRIELASTTRCRLFRRTGNRAVHSLHWVPDMIFRDDEGRVRTGHAPANDTALKHMAHNLTRTAVGKDSMRLRRKVGAWDDDGLRGLIALQGVRPTPLVMPFGITY